MKHLILLALTFAGAAFGSHALLDDPARPDAKPLPAPETFAECLVRVADLVSDLDCPRAPDTRTERALKRLATVIHLDLNIFIDISEGKKVNFFSGLECGGKPGDPESGRKNWRDGLPPCTVVSPEGKSDWVKDPATTVHRYHQGAAGCYRKPADKNWGELQPSWFKAQPTFLQGLLSLSPPGQQCCYDAKGRIVLRGPGAGTPDIVYAHKSVSHQVEADKAMTELKEMEAEKTMEAPPSVFRRARDSFTGARNALHHYVFDARIIDRCLQGWPRGHEAYLGLGWGPVIPKDATDAERNNYGDFDPGI